MYAVQRGDPEPVTCPVHVDPICPSEQQQGEAECLACSKCFSQPAVPGTVSVESYSKHSEDGHDIVTVKLLVRSATLENDIKLQLLTSLRADVIRAPCKRN